MDRILIVSDNELNNSEAAHYAYVNLLPVMLYPEDVKKRSDYMDGLLYMTLSVFQEDTPQDDPFWAAHGKKTTELASNSGYLMDVLETSLESRKAGLLGAANVRGSIAGQILWHLVKPSHGSLESAYQEIIKRHSHNFDDTSELAIPSVAILKKIWGEYKNVSHFWAAEYLLRNKEWQHYLHLGPLSSAPIQPEAAECFVLFLRIASFFRKKLLDQQKPSTLTPLIPLKDCELVWLVVREDGSIISPLDLILP